MEQIEEYLYEAGILSGLGDKFDPTNPEHVKKLQEGLLGAYTGPGANECYLVMSLSLLIEKVKNL